MFAAESAENPDDFGGRKVTLLAKDDAYEPARTVSNMQELIEKDGIFATASLAGTPTNLAVYGDLNEQCIPHMFAATGHPAWGDPVNFPWTTASFLSYLTEGNVWAQYLLAEQEAGNLPDPVKVANLTMNNDFGLAMLDGFKTAVDESGGKIEIAADELHDAAAPNITNELTTLAASEADVVIIGTAGVYCTQGPVGVSESSWEPKVKIIAAVCGSSSFFDPAGPAAEGWVFTGGRKDVTSSQYDDDPEIEKYRAIFDEAGVDWKNNGQAGSAIEYGTPLLKALKDANNLPGGITRTNLVIAARTADFQDPYYVDGIKWHMDGAEDNYPIEATQLARFSWDGTKSEFTYFGEIIDVDGTTPICEWDGLKC